jgi:hypothetical protein
MAMGGGSGGESKTFGYMERRFDENLREATESFPVTDGYFGVQSGTGSSEDAKSTRRIVSNDPIETSRALVRMLSEGGEKTTAREGKVEMWVFGDSRVVYRESLTSDGTPAVQLTISSRATGIRSGQKIHFVQERRQG